MKTHEEVIHDHRYSMRVKEMMNNSCALNHILNHLNNNLEEAEGNPSQCAKLGVTDSKLALEQIGKWIKEYEEKLY